MPRPGDGQVWALAPTNSQAMAGSAPPPTCVGQGGGLLRREVNRRCERNRGYMTIYVSIVSYFHIYIYVFFKSSIYIYIDKYI